MAVIQTENIALKVNGEEAWGYLARPDDAETHPGMVLIQEWWGVEPHIQDLAHKLATEGFVVFVPDLYHGKIATEPNDAQKMLMTTIQNMGLVIQEVSSALDYVKALPGVEPKKLGIMGFCLGGRIAWEMASIYDGLGAVVPFYGGGYDPSPEQAAKITAPVLAVYGEQDGSIPQEQIQKIEQTMKEAGRKVEIKVFPAGHAFLNPDHGMGHEESAKIAWPMAITFLKENLK